MTDVAAAWRTLVDAAHTLESLILRAASMAPEDRQRDLLIALNRLELACLELPDVSPDSGTSGSPNLDNSRVMQVGAAFPEFGQYHTVRPSPVSEPKEVGAGYAIDDLADILRDLDGALQEAATLGVNNGIWRARFGYEYHFGSHLADLRSYVYRLRFFGP